MTLRLYSGLIHLLVSLLLLVGAAQILLLRSYSRRQVQIQQEEAKADGLTRLLHSRVNALLSDIWAHVAAGETVCRAVHGDYPAQDDDRTEPALFGVVRQYFADSGSSQAQPKKSMVTIAQLLAEHGLTADEYHKLAEAVPDMQALESLAVAATQEARARQAAKSARPLRAGHDQSESGSLLMGEALRLQTALGRSFMEFNTLVTRRRAATNAAFGARHGRVLSLGAATLCLIVAAMLASWSLAERRVIAPIGALVSQTHQVAADIIRLKTVVQGTADGKQTETFVPQARCQQRPAPDEIAALFRAHETMLTALSETGEAVARVTVALTADKATLTAANVELKRLSKAKSDFVSAVSHELRTPLTAISEGINLVADGSLGTVNERQVKFLLLAYRNCVRLGSLINDLLDLAKIESGRMVVNLARVELNRVVTETKDTFRASARERGLALEATMPAAPVYVRADERMVRGILTNLLNNALKFTTRGGILVTLTANTDFAQVSVKDSGIGIPLLEQDGLFQKFHQVHHPDRGRPAGTGLGLALTKHMVEMNHGRVWFESQEGTGTTFHFTLPLDDAANQGSDDERSA